MKATFKISALVLFFGLSIPGAQATESQVKLYGVVDAFAGRIKASGDYEGRNAVETSGLSTSFWGISGEEKIGSNLKVQFALEGFFRTNTGQLGRFDGDPFFGRNSYLGLAGDWGGIRLGRNSTPWFISMALFNPLEGSEVFSPLFLQTFTTPPGSPVGNVVAGDTNWNKSILYTSSVWDGFQFNLIYGSGENERGKEKRNVGGNLLYMGDNFSATFAIQRVGVPSPDLLAANATSQTAYLAGMAYDFSFVKLFASYSQANNKITDAENWKNKTMQFGARVPLGSGTVMTGWAQTKQGKSTNYSSKKRNTLSVAYSYPLSKRSDIYTAWRYDKVTDLSSANTLGFGLRHYF